MIYHRNIETNGYEPDLHGLEYEVTAAAEVLAAHRQSFDFIAVTGMSGVIPAIPLSLATGIPVAILRKPTEDCHHIGMSDTIDNWINGHVVREGQRGLFFDDFVSAGDTRRRIIEACERKGATCQMQYTTREAEIRWDHGTRGALDGYAGYDFRDYPPHAQMPPEPVWDLPASTTLDEYEQRCADYDEQERRYREVVLAWQRGTASPDSIPF